MDQNSLKKSFPIYLKEEEEPDKTLSQALNDNDLNEEGMHHADDVEEPHEDNPEPENQMHHTPEEEEELPQGLVDEIDADLAFEGEEDDGLPDEFKDDEEEEEEQMDEVLSQVLQSLSEDDTLNEEDPCWEGYTQVGMKVQDGEEVPNCVPDDDVPDAEGYQEESLNPDSIMDSVLEDRVNELQKLDRLAERILNG